MSKMKERINKAIDQEAELKVYIPGMGFRLSKILSLDDDVMKLELQTRKSRITMHYTALVVQTK